MGLVDDAKPRIRKFLGMDVTGLEELQRNLSEEARQTFQLNAISLADVERELVNSRNWLGDRIYRDHEKGTRFLDNVARKYVENSVKLVYLLGLLQT